eukprot:TRINITY_DN1395_c0_g1_i1.p1 TRINITY_DN1395_c0_g1~~TRINITY_DN1395_c0_g1_i1.p1  ORF type:complete len:108 (+),score=13.27 TRINITY_DN1395_c0_g1_i1:304-627(+)
MKTKMLQGGPNMKHCSTCLTFLNKAFLLLTFLWSGYSEPTSRNLNSPTFLAILDFMKNAKTFFGFRAAVRGTISPVFTPKQTMGSVLKTPGEKTKVIKKGKKICFCV